MDLMCTELHLHPERLTFHDLSTLIVAWLRSHPLSPLAVGGTGMAT